MSFEVRPEGVNWAPSDCKHRLPCNGHEDWDGPVARRALGRHGAEKCMKKKREKTWSKIKPKSRIHKSVIAEHQG